MPGTSAKAGERRGGAAKKTADKPVRRPGGMANLAGALRDRTDQLAQRSTAEDIAAAPALTIVPAPAETDGAPADGSTEVSAPAGPVTATHPPAEAARPDADTVDPSPDVAHEPEDVETRREAAPSGPAVSEGTPGEASASTADSAAPTWAAADPRSPATEPANDAVAEPNNMRTTARRTPRTRGAIPRPQAGTDGKLEASGEQVVKWTIELAPQVVKALNVWERDETKRLGQRVFRERVVDIALDLVPSEMDVAIALVNELPPELRRSSGELFSTRVRSSVKGKLLGLRPDMRVAGIKDIRMRDVYTAALYRYLTSLGVYVEK